MTTSIYMDTNPPAMGQTTLPARKTPCRMSGSPGGAGGRPCGACKFLRRRCVAGCVFAPYFDSEQGAARFSAVHKVFGASNVSKLLLQIPPHKRLDAVATVCYEAQARLQDPVYGCVTHISALQQQVANLQAGLAYLQDHLATLQLPSPLPFPHVPMTTAFSVSDLPSSSNVPAASDDDLSSLFDPPTQSQRAMQHHHRHHQQLPYNQMGEGSGGSSTGGGDLQALARELLERRSAGAKPQRPSRTER